MENLRENLLANKTRASFSGKNIQIKNVIINNGV